MFDKEAQLFYPSTVNSIYGPKHDTFGQLWASIFSASKVLLSIPQICQPWYFPLPHLLIGCPAKTLVLCI